MQIRYFKKLAYIALLIPNLCVPLSEQEKKNYNVLPTIYINQSVYSMDKKLLNSGYKIENVNDKAVLMFKNERISAEAFYMPGMEGDKALKLFIEIKNTMRNATIYLNDTILQQRTNKSGAAYIDLHRTKGRYHLKLEDLSTQRTNNYYFELDKPLKLACHGITDFECQKVYYS